MLRVYLYFPSLNVYSLQYDEKIANHPKNTHILMQQEFGFRDVCEVFQYVELVVDERFHPTKFSALGGVPFIGNSRKMQGLIELLDYPPSCFIFCKYLKYDIGSYILCERA